MSDQPVPKRAHEYVLKEFVQTEEDFAKNMAFLASLKPIIEKAWNEGLNKGAKDDAVQHKDAVLAFLDAADAIQKSAAEVSLLLAMAHETASKIEKGEMSPEEIKTHQKKLEIAIDLHIKNISHAGVLFEKFNLKNDLKVTVSPFPLNKFIQNLMIQKQQNSETMHNDIDQLTIMPAQRIPRYKLLADSLEKQLAEKNIPNVKAEHITLSAEKAEKAAEGLNQQIAQAAKENRIEAFKKVLEARAPVKKSLEKAEFELKEAIDGGISLSQELKKEGIQLGDLVAKINQNKKREPILLQGPKDKQKGEAAASVISDYIKTGFPIEFDESMHATKLWQETLKQDMPDEKMAPIVVDLPPELLKNSASLRQAVKTAAMLQEKGFDIQATPQFKAALEKSQQKSYGFFNVAAKIRQFNFKTDALQFAHAVPTFQPTPPPRPKTALPLLSAENPVALKEHEKKQKEEVHQVVMTPPKKEFLASPGALNKPRKHTSHTIGEHRKNSPNEPRVNKRPRND